eukprot:TRINITY_DN20181_c0_g1_i4.p2 TRINITY_DN20181_c0_g1~~TRINITY_DN20181_c0_g1_i4.p2  ORF type:complete len:127 (-),score=26.06 TRINITY_DN20181_c0_g1_i4:121-501(-)
MMTRKAHLAGTLIIAGRLATWAHLASSTALSSNFVGITTLAAAPVLRWDGPSSTWHAAIVPYYSIVAWSACLALRFVTGRLEASWATSTVTLSCLGMKAWRTRLTARVCFTRRRPTSALLALRLVR